MALGLATIGTVKVAAGVASKFFGGPRKKSACDVIVEADLAEFLSGTSSNATMRRVINNRRSDWNIAFTGATTTFGVAARGAPPVTDQQLAALHVKAYVPLCGGAENGVFTVGGAGGASGQELRKAVRLQFQTLLRTGKISVTSQSGRALSGGETVGNRSGGIPRPTGSTGVPLRAGFGIGNVPLIVGGIVVVLALVFIRR